MTETLPVVGATIHYLVRGRGPVLLIAQSGEGDAERGTDLVDQLAGDFTVVTYDCCPAFTMSMKRALAMSTIVG